MKKGKNWAYRGRSVRPAAGERARERRRRGPPPPPPLGGDGGAVGWLGAYLVVVRVLGTHGGGGCGGGRGSLSLACSEGSVEGAGAGAGAGAGQGHGARAGVAIRGWPGPVLVVLLAAGEDRGRRAFVSGGGRWRGRVVDGEGISSGGRRMMGNRRQTNSDKVEAQQQITGRRRAPSGYPWVLRRLRPAKTNGATVFTLHVARQYCLIGLVPAPPGAALTSVPGGHLGPGSGHGSVFDQSEPSGESIFS